MSVIKLSRPIRTERRRQFQPPWYTVFIYRCPNGHEVAVRANSFRGTTPEPGVGAIECPQCDFEEEYPKTNSTVNDQSGGDYRAYEDSDS